MKFLNIHQSRRAPRTHSHSFPTAHFPLIPPGALPLCRFAHGLMGSQGPGVGRVGLGIRETRSGPGVTHGPVGGPRKGIFYSTTIKSPSFGFLGSRPRHSSSLTFLPKKYFPPWIPILPATLRRCACELSRIARLSEPPLQNGFTVPASWVGHENWTSTCRLGPSVGLA